MNFSEKVKNNWFVVMLFLVIATVGITWAVFYKVMIVPREKQLNHFDKRILEIAERIGKSDGIVDDYYIRANTLRDKITEIEKRQKNINESITTLTANNVFDLTELSKKLSTYPDIKSLINQLSSVNAVDVGVFRAPPSGKWKLESTADKKKIEEYKIPFNIKFGSPPKVIAALSRINSEWGSDVKIQVSTKAITESNFRIRFESWYKSSFNSAEVVWIAVGSPRS